SRAKDHSRTIACNNNLKQLSVCWHLYAADNEDVLPPNDSVSLISSDGTNTSYNRDLLRTLSWCPDHARTDTNSVDLESGLLFEYNRSVAIYHCPADRSQVETDSGDLLPILRNRSYNMSQSVNGYLDYEDPSGILKLLPAWKKFSLIRSPSPSSLFVFIDEHEDTLLDAQFGNPPQSPYFAQNMWWDMPSDRHQQGANLSFADGH